MNRDVAYNAQQNNRIDAALNLNNSAPAAASTIVAHAPRLHTAACLSIAAAARARIKRRKLSDIMMRILNARHR